MIKIELYIFNISLNVVELSLKKNRLRVSLKYCHYLLILRSSPEICDIIFTFCQRFLIKSFTASSV